MGSMYASAIGTSVLQLKEIPPRPAEFDGAICLFGLKVGVEESGIRAALERFGQITDLFSATACRPTVVQFKTHESALDAKRAAHQLKSLCDGIDTLYNEQSYDGKGGCDEDNGRGWCTPLPGHLACHFAHNAWHLGSCL